MQNKIILSTILLLSLIAILLLSLIAIPFALAQVPTYEVGGKILTKTGAPLSGALVILKKTGEAAQKHYTEADGSYTFKVPAGEYVLIPVASMYWVYDPCYIPVRLVGNATNYNFVAQESNALLPNPTPTPTPVPSPTPVGPVRDVSGYVKIGGTYADRPTTIIATSPSGAQKTQEVPAGGYFYLRDVEVNSSLTAAKLGFVFPVVIVNMEASFFVIDGYDEAHPPTPTPTPTPPPGPTPTPTPAPLPGATGTVISWNNGVLSLRDNQGTLRTFSVGFNNANTSPSIGKPVTVVTAEGNVSYMVFQESPFASRE